MITEEKVYYSFDDLIKELQEKQNEIRGLCPDGALSKEDEGPLVMAVIAEGGLVHVIFPHPVGLMSMGPEDAIDFVNNLIAEAEKAKKQESSRSVN